MGFKTNDKVVCIDGNWFDVDKQEDSKKAFDPKKGQVLTVDFLTACNYYLCFQEIPNLDENGEREFYNVIGFRKVEPKFKSNKLSKSLADEAQKEVLEYNPLELKPTKEKVNA